MSLFKDSYYCEETPCPRQVLQRKTFNWGGGLHFKSLVHYHYGATWQHVDCHGAGYTLIRRQQEMD